MSTIANELELRNTYETLTRMYDLRDRVRKDTSGNAEVREEQAIGIEMMIHKIERQVAAYLTAREQQAAEAREQQAAELREEPADEPLVRTG